MPLQRCSRVALELAHLWLNIGVLSGFHKSYNFKFNFLLTYCTPKARIIFASATPTVVLLSGSHHPEEGPAPTSVTALSKHETSPTISMVGGEHAMPMEAQSIPLRETQMTPQRLTAKPECFMSTDLGGGGPSGVNSVIQYMAKPAPLSAEKLSRWADGNGDILPRIVAKLSKVSLPQERYLGIQALVQLAKNARGGEWRMTSGKLTLEMFFSV